MFSYFKSTQNVNISNVIKFWDTSINTGCFTVDTNYDEEVQPTYIQ